MGIDRSDAWFIALTLICAVLAVAAVAFELHAAAGDEPPEPDPMVVQVVTPPAATSPVAATPAPADSEPVERVARTERESEAKAPPARPSHPDRPYVAVRAGAEVAIRSAPGGQVVANAGDRTDFGSPTVFSVDDVRGRWLGVSTADMPNGSLGWVRADPDRITGGYTDFRIGVDLSSHEARLWRGDRLIRRWDVTVGAPGSPTPTGTYAVTDLFRGGINPVYGCCAVALSATQPNLPTGWSGGDRIAFHGTDGALGVDASTGCIRSRDEDVLALVETVPLGTPVRIRP
ncbi:MAG: L,D-transpeptidase family protein [Solirubrobacterales bacterium]